MELRSLEGIARVSVEVIRVGMVGHCVGLLEVLRVTTFVTVSPPFFKLNNNNDNNNNNNNNKKKKWSGWKEEEEKGIEI